MKREEEPGLTLAEWKAWDMKERRERGLNALAFEQMKHIYHAWILPGLPVAPGHFHKRFLCSTVALRSDGRMRRLFLLMAQ